MIVIVLIVFANAKVIIRLSIENLIKKFKNKKAKKGKKVKDPVKIEVMDTSKAGSLTLIDEELAQVDD